MHLLKNPNQCPQQRIRLGAINMIVVVYRAMGLPYDKREKIAKDLPLEHGATFPL